MPPCPCRGPRPSIKKRGSLSVDIWAPPSNLENVERYDLQIRWGAAWVTVSPGSVPPGEQLSDDNGVFWRISGLIADTTYRVRFVYICVKGGGPCESRETRFTTRETASSSSGSACPCSGPPPEVVITGICELGIQVPTSGMTNVSGTPALEIWWNNLWVSVNDASTPPAVILWDDEYGFYWSVAGLDPVTSYSFRHIYPCEGGGSCKSTVTDATTDKNPLCPNPRMCRS